MLEIKTYSDVFDHEYFTDFILRDSKTGLSLYFSSPYYNGVTREDWEMLIEAVEKGKSLTISLGEEGLIATDLGFVKFVLPDGRQIYFQKEVCLSILRQALEFF